MQPTSRSPRTELPAALCAMALAVGVALVPQGALAQPAHDAFPDDAFGFRFGSSADEAARVCAEQSGAWEPAGDAAFGCREVLAGSDARRQRVIRVELCDARVCAITMTEPLGDVSEIDAARAEHGASLTARFGEPSADTQGACVEAALGGDWSCVVRGDAAVRQRWSPYGGTITVQIARGAASPAALTVAYRWSRGHHAAPSQPPALASAAGGGGPDAGAVAGIIVAVLVVGVVVGAAIGLSNMHIGSIGPSIGSGGWGLSSSDGASMPAPSLVPVVWAEPTSAGGGFALRF